MSIQSKRKFLLAAPVVVLPFVCGMFYALGGGKGDAKAVAARRMGLNMELPAVVQRPGMAFLDKAGAYLKAEQDSLRRKAFAQQDPYRRGAERDVADSAGRVAGIKRMTLRPVIRPDPKANELLERLAELKEKLQQPAITSPGKAGLPLLGRPVASERPRVVDTPSADPQMERLNAMLDKVIRIQHPEEGRLSGSRGEAVAAASDIVMPADSASNAIAAEIPSEQTILTGGTIPLRLGEAIVVGGQRISAGEWVYGTVTISNDRLLVHVRAIREGRNIFPTDLQVFDLDGIAGIHVPDALSGRVAKESAAESISGVNLITAEPSPAAMAAEAGVQATKNLLTRKVRLVRVTIRSGYQVLLRNTNGRMIVGKGELGGRMIGGFGGGLESRREDRPGTGVKADSVAQERVREPPGFLPTGRALARCRSGGVMMELKGIWLHDSLLWFGIGWKNRSAIEYTPQYYRWVIRDKHTFKRTAQQELPIEPVVMPVMSPVGRDSSVAQWAGFQPFALNADKELILEVGEKGGGRIFRLVVHPKEVLGAKMVGP
jgi:hypothetical protein